MIQKSQDCFLAYLERKAKKCAVQFAVTSVAKPLGLAVANILRKRLLPLPQIVDAVAKKIYLLGSLGNEE